MNLIITYIKLLFRWDKTEKEFFYFVRYQLGFVTQQPWFYRKALTHKSALSRNSAKNLSHNERLEYLGDSVLDCIIADYLFHKYRDKDEGYLTQMRSKIVNRKSLNDLAVHFKLDKFMVSNNLDMRNNNALGNAFEALIGAIYLDKGYDFTQRFVLHNVFRFLDFRMLETTDTNFKSRLIEIIQRNKNTLQFETREINPESSGKSGFIASIVIDGNHYCEAGGANKKDAEQNAAKVALLKMEQSNIGDA